MKYLKLNNLSFFKELLESLKCSLSKAVCYKKKNPLSKSEKNPLLFKTLTRN